MCQVLECPTCTAYYLKIAICSWDTRILYNSRDLKKKTEKEIIDILPTHSDTMV